MHSTVRQALRPFGDPLFYLALGLGGAAFLLPHPDVGIAWTVLLVKALIEEAAFRWGLQGFLGAYLRGRMVFGPLSLANLLASLAFAGLHFINQPPLWAAAVFFPSLVFGWLWDRHRSLLACWLVHFFYNLLFFHRPF
jgi:uncharacterized protein